MRRARFARVLPVLLGFLALGCSRTPHLAPGKGESPVHAGLRVGDSAPDFTLDQLDGKKTVTISQLTDKPVVLYFGSCTCPHFRASIMKINRTFDVYKEHVHLFVVYTREAHSALPPPKEASESLAERKRKASEFAKEFAIAAPILVDAADNKVADGYDALPERIYVIDRKGKIAYESKPGPLGFRAAAIPPLLDKMLNIELASTAGFALQMSSEPEDQD